MFFLNNYRLFESHVERGMNATDDPVVFQLEPRFRSLDSVWPEMSGWNLFRKTILHLSSYDFDNRTIVIFQYQDSLALFDTTSHSVTSVNGFQYLQTNVVVFMATTGIEALSSLHQDSKKQVYIRSWKLNSNQTSIELVNAETKYIHYDSLRGEIYLERGYSESSTPTLYNRLQVQDELKAAFVFDRTIYMIIDRQVLITSAELLLASPGHRLEYKNITFEELVQFEQTNCKNSTQMILNSKSLLLLLLSDALIVVICVVLFVLLFLIGTILLMKVMRKQLEISHVPTKLPARKEKTKKLANY